LDIEPATIVVSERRHRVRPQRGTCHSGSDQALAVLVRTPMRRSRARLRRARRNSSASSTARTRLLAGGCPRLVCSGRSRQSNPTRDFRSEGGPTPSLKLCPLCPGTRSLHHLRIHSAD